MDGPKSSNPQALQLKLYQAFIFSIPILFSIILFLLFYLFYLKRRASSLSSPTNPILPRISRQATLYVSSVDLKEEIKDKFAIVLFDEELKKKDSQCCVCLGDFEMKEELLQVPSCKHVFHIECIYHWLHNNTTCPLCRCSIISTIKIGNHPPPPTMPYPPLEQQQQEEEEEEESRENERSPRPRPSQPQSVVIHIQTYPN